MPGKKKVKEEMVLEAREHFLSPLGDSALWKPLPQDYITLL